MNDDIRTRYITDANKLEEYIANIEINEQRTWAELSAVIGTPVTTSGKSSGYRSFTRARRMLLKRGIHFKTIIGVGIRRATNEDCIDDASARQKLIRRASKKAILTIDATPNKENLTPNQIAEISARKAVLAISGKINDERTTRKLLIEMKNNAALKAEDAARRFLENR